MKPPSGSTKKTRGAARARRAGPPEAVPSAAPSAPARTPAPAPRPPRRAAAPRRHDRPRPPSRWLLALLFAAGFALVPAAAAVPRAIRFLETIAPREPAVLGLSAPAGSFLLGACLFALAFVAVRIPAIAYVAVHETTHALFGLLSGARVSRLRVSEEAGSVDVSRPNALNLLAPYFFPLPAVAALLLFGLASLAFPMVGGAAGAVAAGVAGAAWGFHLCFTVNALLQRQTDLDAYGFFFSAVLVLLLNELFLFLAYVALSPAELGPSLAALRDFGADAYGWFLDKAFR